MGGFTVHFRSFNQVKVKKVCLTEWPFILLAQKTCCKVDIIIAINELLNLAFLVFNISGALKCRKD